jgi:hypothetical protein
MVHLFLLLDYHGLERGDVMKSIPPHPQGDVQSRRKLAILLTMVSGEYVGKKNITFIKRKSLI